jgi:Transcriptional regulator
MPSSAENNEKIRNEILDKSTALFLSQGYGNTSIRQIAEAMGMLKGNLYYYFKKKEDILLVLFQNSVKVLHAELIKTIGNADPLIRYAVMTRTYMRILDENRALLQIYIEASQVPSLRQAFFDILNGVFTDLLRGGIFSFEEKKLYLSTLASASVEMEMVSHYQAGKLDMEDVISTVIRVKLSLLDIEPGRIDEIILVSARYKVIM